MRDLKTLTKDVIQVVREIGDFAKEKQVEAKITVNKEFGDYATDIDIECEKRLKNKLKKIAPEYLFFSEEENRNPGMGTYWVVDPIDGTKNYFRKLPFWGVSVGLYDSDLEEILLGVVYFPFFHDLFSAYKDGGALLNEKPAVPSETNTMEEAIITIELPKKNLTSEKILLFDNLVKEAYRVRSIGLATTICYVASGSYDAYVDFSGTTKPFDIYASLCIAKEAGCAVSGLERNEVRVTNGKLTINN